MASLQYMSIMYSHWCLKVIWHQTMITRRQNMLTCFRILCTLYGQHSTGAIKYNKYIYQTATYQLVSQLQGKPHSNENKKSHSHNENISIKLTQEHKLYCQSRWSNPWHITTPQIQTDVRRAITVKKTWRSQTAGTSCCLCSCSVALRSRSTNASNLAWYVSAI